MVSSLPIARLVNVSVNLAPAAAQMQNLSTLLLLGSSDVIDVVQRKRDYATLAEVATDFGTLAPEYLAASLYFQQAPQPTLLSIGRWAKTATAGKLMGAPLSAAQQAIALWQAKTTPGFWISIDGIPHALAPASFAAATNLNAVAALIQTAMQVVAANSLCVWDSNSQTFKFTSGTTGVASKIGFLRASSAVGSAAFSGNPANLDTLTLNGTTVTFVTGTPVGNQVLVGGTLAETLANLLTFLNASTDVELLKFNYVVNPANTAIYFTAAIAGVGGNSLTLAEVSAAITLSGGTLTGATAQDIGDMLRGLSTSSGAYVADGIAAEAADACVGILDNQFGQAWYAAVLLGGVNSDHLAVAALIEGLTNKHIYGVTTQEAGLLVSTDTTNLAYQLKALGYKRTAVQYSSSSPYAVCSLLGRILTVDYDGNSTVITLMYKNEPGVTAENLTTTQLNSLEGFNCNVFVAYNNNTAIIEKGVVSSGDFLDIITGTDWLALAIQNEVYNLLYTSPTRIPQTDAGNQLIATVIEGRCSQALTNGLVAPGVWNSAGFGALAQNDFLPKGFYVFAPPVSSQSSADRSARKSVSIQVAAKLAGAIHTADIIVNVNR